MNTSTATNLQPKVYVGTYKKYNESSLKGGWLTLTDYKDYDEFCAACRKLHKDEHDPELMIQDCSNMPDGLSVMEWLSEQEFNDIIEACHAEEMQENAPKFQLIDYSEKAIALVGDTRDIKEQLKQLGGRFNPRLSCGCGWIFPKSKRDEVEKLIQGGSVECVKEEKKSDNGSVWKRNLEEFLTLSNADADYYKKYCVGAVKLNDGFYLLEKPNIETKFCFHDEGPDYEYYKELMASEERLKKHFLAKNLSSLENRIEQLTGSHPLIVQSDYSNGRKSFCPKGYCYERESDVEMTSEQRADLIKALEWSRGEFEKRLNTYLKRYGTSKIHTWTYWADA